MWYIKYGLMLLLVAPGLQIFSAVDEVQVGRYSTIKTVPTEAQKDIFETVVNVQFDETVSTVGDAMRSILRDQGIKLAVSTSDTDPLHALIALQLPKVHRQLGPISLRDALETLAGPVWQLVQDPINRLVSFELCSGHEEEKETDE